MVERLRRSTFCQLWSLNYLVCLTVIEQIQTQGADSLSLGLLQLILSTSIGKCELSHLK